MQPKKHERMPCAVRRTHAFSARVRTLDQLFDNARQWTDNARIAMAVTQINFDYVSLEFIAATEVNESFSG
jgi:hypothetical protein